MAVIRKYEQTVRAEASESTYRGVMQALMDLILEKSSSTISLADVAERSNVSVQTIIRRFGGRDQLFDATLAFATTQIVEEREAPVGDASAAIHVIVDHYELRGDGVMGMLAQEHSDLRFRQFTDIGRVQHREWIAKTFAPWLATLTDERADLCTDLLAVATDVYTWTILRRDRRLSRNQTEQRMLRLTTAILTGAAVDTPATTAPADPGAEVLAAVHTPASTRLSTRLSTPASTPAPTSASTPSLAT